MRTFSLWSALAAVAIGLGSVAAPATAQATEPTTYYVDCSGAGGNGTASTPFSSLSQINALSLQPGDQVLFKVDTVCKGTLRPQGSGTQASPIVIGHYGGGNWPVIQAPGTAAAGPALELDDQSYITVQDLQFTGGYFQNVFVSANQPDSTSQGIILQHLGVNGNAFQPAFNQWVTGTGGIVVEPCNSTSHLNDVTINDVYAFDNHEAGIQIGDYYMSAWDPSSNGYDGENTPNCHMNIPGGTGTNSVWAPIDGVTNATITNSHMYDNDACGLQIFGATGVQVKNNDLYDNGSGNGSNPANPTGMNGEGAWWANTDSVTALNNNAYGNRAGYSGNDGSGLDADTRTSDNTIEYNYLHDNANYGFSLIDGYGVSTDTTVRYNVFVNNGAEYNSAPDIMVSRPYSTGSVNGLSIYNNTLYNARGSTGIRLQTPFSGTQADTINNNLIVRTMTATALSTTTSNATSDYNLFYNSPGQTEFTYAGTSYQTTASYQSHTGQDEHSIAGNPQIDIPNPLPSASQPAAPDFSLLGGSPAIGAGVTIENNGGQDFYGTAVPPTGPPTVGAITG